MSMVMISDIAEFTYKFKESEATQNIAEMRAAALLKAKDVQVTVKEE